MLEINKVVITETGKNKIITQILNSPDFRDSKRYQDLLKYLVEKSTVTDSIKEVEIAHDLFGKDSSFDPGTDPLIRSYISNLRKKLEHYYLTTSDVFEFRLEIPKGQYTVNYLAIDRKVEKIKIINRQAVIYISIICLLTAVVIYQNLSPQKNISAVGFSPNSLWNDFLNSNSPSTLIVLGDYFFLAQNDKPGDRVFVRNIKINNKKEYEDSSKKDPELKAKYEPLEFTFLRPSAAAVMPELMKILGTSPDKVSIKLASQLKWEDFSSHNIIYIGTFKTLYILDTLLAKTNIRYRANPSVLTVLNNQGIPDKNFPLQWRNGTYQYDYSLVLKLYGSKDNVILFLAGFSEIGIMHAIKASVDANLIPNIEKFTKGKTDKQFRFFEMISLNEGVDQTVFHSELKYFSSSQDIYKAAK